MVHEVLSFLLIVIFGTALWTHLTQHDRFKTVLRSLGVAWPSPLSVLVALAEVSVIFLILSEPRLGALTAGLYIGLATLFMWARQRSHGKISDCGCSSSPKPVGREFFLRNISIGAGIGTLFILSGSVDDQSPWVGLGLLFPPFFHWAASAKEKLLAQTTPPIEIGSRRQFLGLGIKGLGIGVAASTAAAGGALAKLSVVGTVEGAAQHQNDFRVGVGMNHSEVRALEEDFPALNSVLQATIGSHTIAWESAIVDGLIEEGKSYRRESRTAMVPIADGEGKGVAIISRTRGTVSRKASGPLPVLEERAQILRTTSSGEHVILLVSKKGEVETLAPNLHPQKSARVGVVPTPSPSDDLTECELDSVWAALDDGGCKRCRLDRHIPCRIADPCLVYRCVRTYACCMSTPCTSSCNICDGRCCDESCNTCGSCF